LAEDVDRATRGHRHVARRHAEAGERLVLDEAPLIVAAGAEVERRCTVALGPSATPRCETIVLEPAGMLDSDLQVTLGGIVLLHDGLRFGPAPAAHVALAPGHRFATPTPSACSDPVNPRRWRGRSRSTGPDSHRS
jgi:hypothetical protein